MKPSRRRAPAQPPPARGTSPLILVVEDNLDQREMYCAYLASQNFRFVSAGDGATGVVIAHRLHPDLIVMDLSLPVMDGCEAARRLKRDPRTAHIPILACTAHALGAVVEQALAAGCDGYVVKPCLPQDLVKEIRRLLAAGARRRRPARRA